MKESLEFTQNLLDDKSIDINESVETKLNFELTNVRNAIFASKQVTDDLTDKLRTLEDRNRRNNLRINGIAES